MIIFRHALIMVSLFALVALAAGCGDDKSTSGSGPILTLSQANLEFTTRAGSSPNPAQIKVTVKINGTSTANFTVTGGATWLEVATYGTDTIYVTARAEALPAAEYNDTLWVDSEDASNGPVPLPILLTVNDWIQTDPPELEFAALIDGGNPDPQWVKLSVYAGSTGSWVALSNTPWIVITDGTGTFPDSLEIGVDISGLSNGQYTGSVVFTSPELPSANYVMDCELNVSSWLQMTVPDQIGQLSNYEGLCILNAQTAWITGWFPSQQDQRSVVYRTDNGGATWNDLTQILNHRMGGVSFVDVDNGWVVGREAAMVMTDDGGDHWNTIANLPVGDAIDLRVVKFLAEDTGWVIGTQGTVLRTYDAGANWTKKTPTSFDLTDICALDKSRIWISGNHGVILQTTDGGDNWSVLNTGTIKDLRSVHFVDALHGWAVGVSGTVLSTTDGGASWTSQDCGFTVSLHDVWFASETLGWTVGLEGVILRTDDGGVTWTQQLSGTDLGLYELQFFGENAGMIVGEGGTLLRTASGGF